MHDVTKKEEYATLIAKKSERLVTALYLVTDLMSELEPIKHSLRKNGVALLTSMNTIAQLDVKDRFTEFKMSLKGVNEIISLLHVAVTTGIVSEMNGTILLEGFRTLQSVLEKKQPFVSKEMLTIENEDSLLAQDIATTTTSSYDIVTPLTLLRLQEKGDNLQKAKENLEKERLLSKLHSQHKAYPQGKAQINNKVITSQPHKSPYAVGGDSTETSLRGSLILHSERQKEEGVSSFQIKKTSRREQILHLFVPTVDMSIKDISMKIKGCSEKTIQRELNTLVSENIIERIGEKRWSRYVLK